MLGRSGGRSERGKVFVLTNMFPTPERPWFGNFVDAQVEDLRALGVDLEVQAFDGTVDRGNYLRAARDLRSPSQAGGIRPRPRPLRAHWGGRGVATCASHSETTFHGGDYSGQAPWQTAVSWFVSRLSTPIFVSAQGTQTVAAARGGGDTRRRWTRISSSLEIEGASAGGGLGWDEHTRYALLPGLEGLAEQTCGSVLRLPCDFCPRFRP